MPDPALDPVERFFAGFREGGFPHDLFSPGFTAWTTASGPADPVMYRAVPAMLRTLFPAGLAFTIDAITREKDRAVVEAHSEGCADDGTVYANRYVFIFRLRDGRIAAVAEHLDPTRVPPALGARMMATLATLTGSAR